MLVRAEITRRLPKGLGDGLIAPGVEIPPGIIIPPGTTISPGTVLPADWAAGEPTPPETATFPGGFFPPDWTPGDPVPPGVLLPPSYYIEPAKLISDIGPISPMTLGLGPGSLVSGRSNAAGAGGAGCGCCKHKDNPAQNVGIGYETAEMELSGTQELTVENAGAWCEGHFYEWVITSGGGELSAGEGLSVIYTAPTSGHGCPGNTVITLFCCGEVMDTLEITIDYGYSIEYNYVTSAETIARETSELIYVTANNTPLTWSVEGTGFSLEHAETDGCGNVLHADETACGSATIRVTGCDGQEAVGYVRCTTGGWVSIYSCGIERPFGCTVIEGKYKVRAYCKYTSTPGCPDMPDPPCELLCPDSECVAGDPCRHSGNYYYYVKYAEKWEWQC
jgi:hypothetical protein